MKIGQVKSNRHASWTGKHVMFSTSKMQIRNENMPGFVELLANLQYHLDLSVGGKCLPLQGQCRPPTPSRTSLFSSNNQTFTLKTTIISID